MRITDDYHCWTYGQCARRRKNQAGANLNRHELHDELQQYVCQLPSDMQQPGTSSKRGKSRHDKPGQCSCKRFVPVALHKSTAAMFTNVRAYVALAMICHLPNSSGNLAIFAAILLASSLVSNFAADWSRLILKINIRERLDRCR